MYIYGKDLKMYELICTNPFYNKMYICIHIYTTIDGFFFLLLYRTVSCREYTEMMLLRNVFLSLVNYNRFQ